MVQNTNFQSNPQLQTFLSGRQLLVGDIPFSHEEVQQHFENGYVQYREGLVLQNSKYKCNRCGNSESHFFGEFPCVRCGQKCHYCRKCIMMGRVSSCSSLVCWCGPPKDLPATSQPLEWQGTLSEGQQHASDQLVEAVNLHQDLLVWAVCGAGKTEVLFAGIGTALSKGKRVCLATPRTDVVLELTPRLRKVFPDISVASLYGGSDDRHQFAALTIATTHQLLRFYQAFDMMIVDEVDAFPYTADESLQFAVQQARKKQSSLIFLTATPNEKWQRQCRSGKRSYVTIPARFHRHPLSLPKFVWCGNWKSKLEKKRLPENVLQWARSRIQNQKQALIFFPNIRLMEKTISLFRTIDPKIETVHAEDPLRKEKVQAMRNHETLILLTTTILERGVTFPNIDVAVVGAEEEIFTESALVQISGRVGRSSKYPSGNITFFHYGKSQAMIKAYKQIDHMNKEAYRKGLIDYV
ncbi:DEAD/DEAH box helicase [Pseudoneobacillus rhizosphaerae]|uniref:ComF operon protein 1 n=1 Tax=Pseudoneobacillus rhizosphaerae TaxID=2880968 RepID=A0A9C7GAB2_9BACI|nr:DEAD/DEAH box helicase [Pseudoneobacillus rhizosphaerae]CAG9608467.1 ComF operon protein 1 [Pseudoneobacillus rhizosphaerae]